MDLFKESRNVQGKIRAMAIYFGASVIYTSAEKKTNIAQLRKYIFHRLYPEAIDMELTIEVCCKLFFYCC